MMFGLFPIRSGWISQKFGTTHKGIDIGYLGADGANLPVRAWNDGIVLASGKDAEGGVYVVLRHENGQWTGYWHLVKNTNVAKGMKVKQGDTIGIRGNTGLSSGVHLHFVLTREAMTEGFSIAKMNNNAIDPLNWVYKLKTDNIEKAENHDQYPLPIKPELPDPVERDEYTHQVEVKATALRVRRSPSLSGEVEGFAKVGLYNVLAQKEADGYLWDEIAKGKWIATNDEWTKDFPARDPLEVEVEKLKAEIAEISRKNADLNAEKEKLGQELKETKATLKTAQTKISKAVKALT